MKIVVLIAILMASMVAQAEISNRSKTNLNLEPPRWTASFDSYFYDFQGRHFADSGQYGFEGVTYAVQMFNLSYAYTPTLHFGLSAKHIRNYAETQFGPFFSKDQTQGFGDTQLRATKTFLDPSGIYVADVALSIPTGSISEKNANAPAFNYPYNMQLGSGTYDLYLSLIHMKDLAKHRLTSAGTAVVRTGRNDFSYRRGNEYIAKLKYTYLLSQYIQPGLWLNFRHVQRLHGADSTLGRLDVLQFYHTPRNFWDLTPHVSGQYPLLEQLTLRGEVGRPLWQESNNIDNIQVYNQWFAQLGLVGQF